jgi:HlyD family secretion protein
MWQLLTNRRVLQGGALMGILLVVALWPEATAVEVGSVTRGALAVTIAGSGETRVHHRFVVSAPVAGRIEQFELVPGNGVERDKTVVARLYSEPVPALDAHARAEAAAAVEAARSALDGAREEEERAHASLAEATADLKRDQELFEAGSTTQQSLEARRNLVVSAEESVNAALYSTATAVADFERARARLSPSRPAAASRLVDIVSPVDGVVLRRFYQGEGVVPAGERLLEIGDPSHVEIIADLTPADATKVEPGMRVDVEHWGGDTPLAAWVERVEPETFTKVSEQGAEERLTHVVINFEDDRAAWRAMGEGFRVQVRIAIWEAEDVLRVPLDALVRAGDQWAAYVVQNGRARRVFVEVGERTDTQAEVRKGLNAGQQVVRHPPDTLTENARVAVGNE